MAGKSPNDHGSRFPIKPGAIGWAFLTLNLYYTLRLALALLNRFRVLSLQSMLALLVSLALAGLLAALSLRGKLDSLVRAFLDRANAILELFVYFLFLSQVLEWAFSFLTTAAAFEIRSWLLANLLGLVACQLIRKGRELIPSAPLVDSPEPPIPGKAPFRRAYLAGLGLVAVLVAGYWAYTQVIAPLPHYANYDPEYSYMLTALTPFKDGWLYARLDHPGTLLQVVGSWIHVLTSPLTLAKAGYPIYLATSQPGTFISLARLLVLAGALAGILLVGTRLIRPRSWPEIFAGLSVALAYFASHREALEFTAIWSPNSFNFVPGTLILFALLAALVQDRGDDSRVLKVALAAGLAATFHVYLVTLALPVFTAVLLTPLLSRSGWKKALSALGKSAFQFAKGYLLGFLVVLDQLRSFLDWIFGVATHSGYYGQGEEGFLNLSQALANLRGIVQDYPELVMAGGFLALTFLVFTLLGWKRVRENPGAWSLGLGVLLQALVVLLLVLKAPRGRYLLSVAALLPVLAAALVVLLQSSPRTTRWLYPALFTLLVGCFTLGTAADLTRHQEQRGFQAAYQEEVASFLADFAASRGLAQDQLQKYWTYGSYSECYSLWFGSEYAKNLFNDEIREYCGANQEYSISLWSGKIIPDRTLLIEEIGPDAVIIGKGSRLDSSLDLEGFQEVSSSRIPDLRFYILAENP